MRIKCTCLFTNGPRPSSLPDFGVQEVVAEVGVVDLAAGRRGALMAIPLQESDAGSRWESVTVYLLPFAKVVYDKRGEKGTS
jgi:hypothetical protein